MLAYYNITQKLKLAADAFLYGIGAVISHVYDNRPIAYASHTLSRAEKNYSQIDREESALIFGVQKFHTYLYGRKGRGEVMMYVHVMNIAQVLKIFHMS